MTELSKKKDEIAKSFCESCFILTRTSLCPTKKNCPYLKKTLKLVGEAIKEAYCLGHNTNEIKGTVSSLFVGKKYLKEIRKLFGGEK